MPTTLSALRKRTFEIIEIGAPDDYVSRIYDFFSMFAIFINLLVACCIPLRNTVPPMVLCF